MAKIINSLFNKAENKLGHIEIWLIAYKLTLNTNKVKCIVFQTPNSKPVSNRYAFALRDKVLEEVKSH